MAIARRLDPVASACPLGTHDGLMGDLEPSADGLKRRRRLGAAPVRDEVRRSARPDARRIEDHQRGPGRFRWGHRARKNSAGIPLQDEKAPPLDAVAGQVHLAAIAAPICMAGLGLVGVGLWGRLAPALPSAL